MRALLLENIHAGASARLAKDGYQVETLPRALGEDELIDALRGVSLLGIRSTTHITGRALAAAPELEAIGAFCIGVNQIDVAAASSRGVAVFNAPFSNTRSVVELAMAEIIAMARRLPEKNALMHAGSWDKSAAGSHEVRGRKIGIVGYGNIGSQLSVMAEALGMDVRFHDVVAKLPLGNAQPAGSLEELFVGADVVTVHVPDTPQTRGMIGRAQFDLMRPGTTFINASRGTVVDIEAACQALETGRLRGAAFDVFPAEPKGNAEEFVSPLRRFDNVILTPHIAGSTVEAQANIGTEVAEKLVRYSDNGSTLSAVNFPEVSLPAHPGNHRLLHVHHNVPGMLSQINAVFSRNGININGQYLMTRAKIGYVVIDVDQESSRAGLEALAAIEGTIRTRVLF